MPATIALGEGHLYERDFELERIDAALAAARRGNGGVLVVEGAAGIGKTSLGLAARLSATAAGMTVLTARGAGLERDFAWGVVRQWFSTELAGLSPGERADVLGGAAALAADALGEPAPGARAGPSLPGMLHGRPWLIANLSQRAPVLLVLDDAHWADEPSLRLVSYLGARAPDLPVLVLVATRPAAQGAAPHALAAVVSDPEAAVLRPAPLSEPAMQILVEERSGRKCDPDFARACRLATGGNPFLLGELVRALDEAGVTPRAEEADRVAGIRPRALSAAILGRLPAESQALARAVAVLDVDAGLAAASELAGLSVDAATEAAAELTRAGLLEDR
ncbi:MAG: hypothetical protein QOK31_65, partial [Solirubrobacteraceae bacterium]|nr:hypothetical protein [Solirubrobacteraceae bacterium]